MDWQGIAREVVKEAMSSRWRDYALSKLPDIPGWRLQKPKGLADGDAVYTGRTKGGIPVKVTVNKMNGVWQVEGGGLSVEDEINGLDQKNVQFALDEASTAVDQHIVDRKRT